jgi:hypothetical protein
MAKIEPILKAKLLAAGKLPEYVAYLDDLRDRGVMNKEAERSAVVKFLGAEVSASAPAEHVDKSSSCVNVTPPEPPRASSVPEPVKAPEPAKAESVKPVVADKPVAPRAVPVLGLLPIVDHALFSGKSASKVEQMAWVCANLTNPSVKPESCPCAEAWSMLAGCRRSPTLEKAFLDKYMTPAKTAEKPQSDIPLDGGAQIETIEKILNAKYRAENCGMAQLEARRAHNAGPSNASLKEVAHAV